MIGAHSGGRFNRNRWQRDTTQELTKKFVELIEKLKKYKQKMEEMKEETPGPQTKYWLEEFERIVGKL